MAQHSQPSPALGKSCQPLAQGQGVSNLPEAVQRSYQLRNPSCLGHPSSQAASASAGTGKNPGFSAPGPPLPTAHSETCPGRLEEQLEEHGRERGQWLRDREHSERDSPSGHAEPAYSRSRSVPGAQGNPGHAQGQGQGSCSVAGNEKQRGTPLRMHHPETHWSQPVPGRQRYPLSTCCGRRGS